MQQADTAAPASPQYLRLTIAGMHCANCVVAVERCLARLPDVKGARRAIRREPRSSRMRALLILSAIKDTLTAEGYTVTDANETAAPTFETKGSP